MKITSWASKFYWLAISHEKIEQADCGQPVFLVIFSLIAKKRYKQGTTGSQSRYRCLVTTACMGLTHIQHTY